jgi:hypothetical protein
VRSGEARFAQGIAASPERAPVASPLQASAARSPPRAPRYGAAEPVAHGGRKVRRVVPGA